MRQGQKIALGCWLSVFLSAGQVLGADRIDIDSLESAHHMTILAENGGILGLENYKPESGKTFKSFPALDQQLERRKTFHWDVQEGYEPEFDAAYIDQNFAPGDDVEKLLDDAYEAIQKLEELNNFVDVLTGNELLQLPVGLRKRDPTSDNEVVIAVSSVRFHPEYSELKLWAKLIVPHSNTPLFFGAEGVKFSHDGALIGDAKLVLLGDFPIPFNGDNWLLTLKGGVDLRTGSFLDKTYLSIDCNGLKEIGLQGDLKVSRNVLLPLKPDGSYLCWGTAEPFQEDENGRKVATSGCYVETSFQLQAAGWNDVLLDVTLPDFEMVGLKGWGFHLENAVLDLSDNRNSPNIRFPAIYEQFLRAGNQNLWRGIYAREVSVTLPPAFAKTSGADRRVQFAANDLIVDSYGLSGTFSATNLLTPGEGAAGNWGFTVDSLSLSLAVNTVAGGALAGDIAVPIMEQPLGYTGWIAEDEYGLSVAIQQEYDVPMFLAKMQLAPNSSVTLKVKDDNFYPSANLTGQLTIAGSLSEEDPEATAANDNEGDDQFVFRGIKFEELELQTEPGEPYIQAKYFGFDGEFRLLFFPVTVSDLQLVTPDRNTAGLKFGVAVHLDDMGKGAETTLSVLGRLEDQQLHRWQFDKVEMSRIAVDFERGGVRVAGGLEIMKKDPEYGDGFRGDLTATVESLNMELAGKGMFGARPVDESVSSFRYWFVDVWQSRTSGGDGNFLINSFMGGLSNRMTRSDGNSFWTPTKSVYKPNRDSGLGIRAGVGIGTKGLGSFAGRAALEMEFNRHGGLNRMGFVGEGALMGEVQAPGASDDPYTQYGPLADVLEKADRWAEENPNKYNQLMAYGNYLGASKEMIPVREVAASGKIGAYVGIERDFTTSTFHGQLEIYLDLQGLRGAGPSNRAGWAVLHSGPEEWYLHIGSPTDRLGLVFGIGSVAELEVGGYFMTGDVMPTQLAPHPRVLQILGDDIMDKNRRPNELSAGRGFAFGLSFSYRQSFQYLIFYATLEVGAGFDVMHRHYPDVRCRGRSGPVGNNGWYSMGNVYAWLYGEFGVRVKLFFVKLKVKIAEAGIAALLQGQFPNPEYFKGYVGMYFSVMGGLVKGRLRLKITFGDECEFVDINPFTDVPIISDLTPINGARDVNVFTSPQAIFNFGVGQPFSIDTEEGYQTFKINLERFILLSGGREIPGALEWSDEGDAVTFVPDEVLPSQEEVRAIVEVSFEERVNGRFSVVTKGGRPIVEKRESTFRTDVAPDHIPLENIAYMYPVKDQQNFFPQEYNAGYIKLKRGQAYLFGSQYTIRLQTASEDGTARRSNLSYDIAQKQVGFGLPPLNTSTNYTMDVMVFPPGQAVAPEIVLQESTTNFDDEGGFTNWYDPAGGTTGTETASASVTVSNRRASSVAMANATPKSLLNFDFGTSQHPNFRSKMRSLSIVDHITDIVTADIHTIHLRLRRYENFDIPEVLGTKYNGSRPMIYGEAILRDPYYRVDIFPLNYQTYPLDGIRVNRVENVLGVPPVRGIDVPNWYAFYLQNNPTSSYVTERYPIMYNLPYHYKSDFLHLQHTVVNRYLNGTPNQAMYERYKYLIEGVFPAMRLGTYRSYLIYRTPGDVHQNRFEVKFINN